jgi:hypothetical protein
MENNDLQKIWKSVDVLPLIYLLTVLSIHVYFEDKPFIELVNSGDSIHGLLVGIPFGLFISYYLVRRIRKSQLQNIEFLKDLYNRLSKNH